MQCPEISNLPPHLQLSNKSIACLSSHWTKSKYCNPKEAQDAIIKELKRNHKSVFEQCPGRSDFFQVVGSVGRACSILSSISEEIIRFKHSGELYNTEPGKQRDTDLENGNAIRISRQAKSFVIPGFRREYLLHLGPLCAVVHKNAQSEPYARAFTTDDDPSTGILPCTRAFFNTGRRQGLVTAYRELTGRFSSHGLPPTILSAFPSLEDISKPSCHRQFDTILRAGADLLPYAPEAAGESGVSFFHCHAIIHVCHSIAQRAA